MEAIPEGNLVRPQEDGQKVTRAHLESMTTSDLISMADNLGIDIPPDLDRIFIIEELLEIASPDEAVEDAAGASDAPDTPGAVSADVSAVPAASSEADMTDSGLVESVPLPKHYNITFIEVMIRDPLWAFVFWEIKAQDKEHFEKAQDFEGYYLKVSPWVVPAASVSVTAPDKLPARAGDSRLDTETEGVFTIPVSPNDTAWYLGLNPTMEQGKSCPAQSQNDQKQYKVELCAGMRGSETVLAVSTPFRLPHLHELPTGGEYSLIRLSGYGDFRILRNNERIIRAKRSASAASHE